MKKILATLLTALLALASFAGCIGGDEEPVDAEPVETNIPGEGEAPIAAFTFSTAEYEINVDASGSSDPAGRPLRYLWEFGDASRLQFGIKEYHEYEDTASFTVTLTVDNGIAESTAMARISVVGESSGDSVAGGSAYMEISENVTNKWAVVDGLSDYPGTGNDLPDCHTDALNVWDYLVGSCNFSRERTFLLLNSSATTKNVKAAIDYIGAHSDDASVFVYYHSGHGPAPGANPTDGAVEAGICLYDENAMRSTLNEWFSVLKYERFVFITDSCFAGEFGGVGATQFAPGLTEGLAAPGRVIISSSFDGITSSSTGSGGAFTIPFITWAMREGKGDGCTMTCPPDAVETAGETDGIVTIQEAYWYTYYILSTGQGISPVHTSQLPEMNDQYGEPFYL